MLPATGTFAIWVVRGHDLPKVLAHTPYYWRPSLRPYGYVAISSTLLLGLSSLLGVIDRPWDTSRSRHSEDV